MKRNAGKVLLPCMVVGLMAALWGWMVVAAQGASPPPLALQGLTEPPARYGHTMVEISGSIYLFGGNSGAVTTSAEVKSAAGEVLNDLWKYDFDDNVWSPHAAQNPPPARAHHSAAASTGRMYIFGGVNPTGTALNDIWAYDPATNAWSERPSLGARQPVSRSQHSAVAIGDRIYIFGGVDQYGYNTDDYAWSYDPATGNWERRDYTDTPLSHGHSAGSINGQMVLFGGNDGRRYLDSIAAYNPETNHWRAVGLSGTRPISSGHHAAVIWGNRMWTFGGEAAYSASSSLSAQSPGELDYVWEFEFDPEVITATVRWLPRLPGARSGAAAAALSDTVIVIFGGTRGGQPVAETFIYQLSRLHLPAVFRNLP